MIPLPEDFQGRYLFVRVYSNGHFLAGVSGNRAAVGGYDDLTKQAVGHQLDQFVVGAVLIFIGLFWLVMYLRRHDRTYLAFGGFVSCTGVFLLFINTASRYFLEGLPLRIHLGYAAFLMVPVGLFRFYETIAAENNRKLLRRAWQIHAAYAMMAYVADLAGVRLQAAHNLLVAVFPLELVALLILSLTAARRGSVEAKIFNIGFSALGLGALHDFLVTTTLLPDWRHLVGWGVLGFVLALGYILERRFTKNVERLHAYSSQLEAASNALKRSNLALEEANVNLERRVLERTQDLNEKNLALEQALRQLGDAQQQLLLSEKMASLGNLVAGVVHEINTPVGAIRSAADTSVNSVARLERALGASGVALEEDRPGPVKLVLEVLQDNQHVIREASDRINRLVRSLKNFARLDQAERQEADLNQGLESTLAVVQHEFGDRIRVVRDFGALPRVLRHPGQLNQLFMNLLVNASQAITGQGTVTISTVVDGDSVAIRVKDSGEGIPPDHLSKIFDPGFTTTAATPAHVRRYSSV